MNSENIFGQRFFELRKTAGMTQKQLGETVGLSMQAINDIEKGRRETTLVKAAALALSLNTTIEYLIGNTNTPINPNISSLKSSLESDSGLQFSLRLKALRESKNLSMQEAGKETLLGTRRYKNLEEGQIPPVLNELVALADYFDVSIDYLVGRTDNSEINR